MCSPAFRGPSSLTLAFESFPISLMRFLLLLLCLTSAGFLPAQTPDVDRTQFDGHCAGCHGKTGNGGELGPAIVARLAAGLSKDSH
jgi:cytochrome c553